MVTRSAGDRLPRRPQRVLVAGTSGSGKSTLARVIADQLELPYTELDSLHHGPGWTVRESFIDDVRALAEQPSWVTEYQYAEARPILLARCELVVVLLLPRWLVMTRVARRTLRRGLRREVLWNGNVEPPLRTFFTDRDHVMRWAWRTHRTAVEHSLEIQAGRPGLPMVVLRSRRDVDRWVSGPLADVGRSRGGER